MMFTKKIPLYLVALVLNAFLLGACESKKGATTGDANSPGAVGSNMSTDSAGTMSAPASGAMDSMNSSGSTGGAMSGSTSGATTK